MRRKVSNKDSEDFVSLIICVHSTKEKCGYIIHVQLILYDDSSEIIKCRKTIFKGEQVGGEYKLTALTGISHGNSRIQ